MFSKVANAILFFRLDIRMGLLYLTLCIGETCRGAPTEPGHPWARLGVPPAPTLLACPPPAGLGGQGSLSPGGDLCPSLSRRLQL